MNRVLAVPLALAAAIALAACGSSGSSNSSSGTTTSTTAAVASASGSVAVGQTGLGAVLVNGQGRTLYHLMGESATSIQCTGGCTSTWPPLTVAGGQNPTFGPGLAAASLTLVTRPDGTKQVAFNGQPLYTYAGDSKAGDTNGEGVGGVWHVVKLTSAPIPTPATVPGGITVPTGVPTITTRPSAYGGY